MSYRLQDVTSSYGCRMRYKYQIGGVCMETKRITTFGMFFVITIFLTGCYGTGTTSNIREVELFPMGEQTYTLFVRGNSFITNHEVKKRWYEEVNKKCPNGFSVEEVGVKEVKVYDLRKPAVEGKFSCKK